MKDFCFFQKALLVLEGHPYFQYTCPKWTRCNSINVQWDEIGKALFFTMGTYFELGLASSLLINEEPDSIFACSFSWSARSNTFAIRHTKLRHDWRDGDMGTWLGWWCGDRSVFLTWKRKNWSKIASFCISFLFQCQCISLGFLQLTLCFHC